MNNKSNLILAIVLDLTLIALFCSLFVLEQKLWLSIAKISIFIIGTLSVKINVRAVEYVRDSKKIEHELQDTDFSA